MPFAILGRLCKRSSTYLGKIVSLSILIFFYWGALTPVTAKEYPKFNASSGICSTTGAINAITLSNVPARTSGVAPLAVFFDASGTTATSTNRPFHDLEYRWNFGESSLKLQALTSGSNWTNGSTRGSRTLATGPVAAHVYETPGNYNVTLEITDGTSIVSNSCLQIVVKDPDVVFANKRTICVGATSAPTQGEGGCPIGARTEKIANFALAISRFSKTGNRVLFKSGDTFTAATTARIASTGPGTIGSFGQGPLPVIQMTGNTDTLILSSRSTPKFSDWRVMDLELDGLGNSVSHGIGLEGGATQITTLRLTLRNFEAAIGFGGDLINWWNNTPGGPVGHSIDQLAIVDSKVVYGPNTSYGAYITGNRVSFMGNNIDNGGIQLRHDALGNKLHNPDYGSHVTRFPYLGKAVISNNSLSRPGFDRHLIKLNAPSWTNGLPDITLKSNYSSVLNGDGYSRQIVISDNKLTDFRNPWSITISPEDSANDQRIRDVILERNLHVTTPTSQVAQVIRAQEVTSRNNLIIGGGGTGLTLAMIDVDGAEPPASNVRIYNNTQYSADAIPNSNFTMVVIGDSRVSNITIKNNLAYAPNAQSPQLYTNAGATNVVVSNNSTNSQIKNTSPLFTATHPKQISDLTPTADSYAINSGATVPVWSDFFRNSRPQDGINDIGAIEQP